MATDILRYDIISEYGGVYADINFEFNRVLDVEICNYDFMTMSYSKSGLYIDNFFFLANKHHHVIDTIQMLVEKNFSEDPPVFVQNFIKSNYTDISKATDVMTANPTFQAFAISANKYGNVDVVYPHCSNYRELILRESSERSGDDDKNISNEAHFKNSKDKFVEEFVGSRAIIIAEYFVKKVQSIFESSDYREIMNLYSEFGELAQKEICSTEFQCLGRDGTEGRSWVDEWNIITV